ncbi:hypothetical protein ACD591_18485 [Rufibacter glacialis]|uniref:Beta-glucuronidase C-terminal domain-containing protein n=1 Tax=Rufibacter glacialis TaxID=1259555 RepID=A0A5M8QVT4_9BACT|nr:hypothetical protein [Rufibacter glacialis]KAA6438182.1 hypothetical protein FOE74_00665 [Rufibacter glacialis]
MASLLVLGACNSGDTNKTAGNNETGNKNGSALTVNPQQMKRIGSVDERYQSYNVEMVEVVGGEFWKPYKMMESLPTEAISSYGGSEKSPQMYRKLDPINLADKRLRILANGLAPAYVRVSGSWANATYFQDNDQPAMAKAPEGFVNLLTRSQWKGVIDFLKATDGQLVTSFAVSNGVRDNQGIWTPKEAQKIVNYTKSLGGKIAAAELFNEPNVPLIAGEMDSTYGAGTFAKDVAVFNAWASKEVPDMLVLGPGNALEGLPGIDLKETGMRILTIDQMMTATPKPVFDVFTYHYYGAISMRITRSGPLSIKPENALDSAWFHKIDVAADYHIGKRDKYLPGKPIWITETAQAAAGGDPYAATYLDCFRYLYQLGTLAQKGLKVIMHNTLVASEYSLIDQDTHLPKPNYWAALLWNRFMGTEVYDAGTGAPGVYLFAHNMKGRPGGITLLVINTNQATAPITIPSNAEQYTLTSTELQGTTVQLNGQELKLGANDELPGFQGKGVKAGQVQLPATSITFLTFAEAGNQNLK